MKKHQHKRSFYLLIIAVLLTVFSAIYGFYYIHTINSELMSKVENLKIKLELSRKIQATVFNRIIVFQSILASDDPFFKDTKLMQHQNLADQFISVREQLQNLSKSPIEKKLFSQLMTRIKISSNFQSMVLEEMTNGDKKPQLQEQIANQFIEKKDTILTKLHDFESYYIDSHHQAIKANNSAHLEIIVLFSLCLLLALTLILFNAIKLIKNIDENKRQQQNEIDQQKDIQNVLEDYQYQLTKKVKSQNLDLKDNKALLQTIMDTAPVAIVVVNNYGEIYSFNAAAEQMFGYPKEEIKGMKASCLMPETSLQANKLRFQHYSGNGNTDRFNVKTEAEGLSKLGKTFPIEIQTRRIQYNNNDIFIEIISDISGRLLAQQELLQSRKLEAVGQLSSGIAHEINSPMQYISENFQFAHDSVEDIFKIIDIYEHTFNSNQAFNSLSDQLAKINEAKEEFDLDFLREELPLAFTQTQEGIDNIKNIVNAMKTFSHSNQSDKKLIDLNNLIEKASIITRHEWKYHTELLFEFGQDLPQVEAFSTELTQTFVNFIVNSAQAINELHQPGNIEKPGKIIIRTYQQDRQLIVKFMDNGGGIADEIKDRIFEPFFTTKEVGVGTGQGLSSAYTIIKEKHQGSLSYSANDMNGSTFTISLPL